MGREEEVPAGVEWGGTWKPEVLKFPIILKSLRVGTKHQYFLKPPGGFSVQPRLMTAAPIQEDIFVYLGWCPSPTSKGPGKA